MSGTTTNYSPAVTSAKPLPFNGEDQDWRVWKGKTLAQALRGNFKQAFTTKELLPTQAIIDSGSATVAQQIAFARNVEAYTYLALSCIDNAYGYVESCETTRAPDGDAYLAWSKLIQRYEPTDIETNYTKIEDSFTSKTLVGLADDPEKWIQELEYWNQRMRSVKTEYMRDELQMKTYVMNHLPAEYNELKTKLTGELESKTFAQITKMVIDFRARNYTTTSKNAVLNTTNSNSKNKKCEFCGKKGHKASDCWQKEENKDKRPHSYNPGKKDNGKKSITCQYCHKKGHYANQCRSNPANAASSSGMFVGAMYCMPIGQHIPVEQDKWLLDSGATCNVTPTLEILHDILDTNEKVTIGDGTEIEVRKKGSVMLTQRDGQQISLSNVFYSPSFVKNIISLRQLLTKGNKLTLANQDEMIITAPNGTKLIAQTQTDSLYYVTATSKKNNMVQLIAKKHEYTLEEAHRLCGHADIGTVKRTAKRGGWTLTTDTMRTCGACALAKAQQKNVPKTTMLNAEKAGERLFIDISGPYNRSAGGNTYWVLVVDDFSRKKWSYFIKQKNDIGKVIKPLLEWLTLQQKPAKYIRSDNAGENLKYLEALSKQFAFTLEITAPHTPQQNGVVERAFVTLRNRGYASMLDAKLKPDFQQRLWPEFMSLSTILANSMVASGQTCTPDEIFFGNTEVKLLDHLIIPGRLGFVTDRT
jgi:hypothetical protein